MALSLNFLDRWELAVFNKYSNGDYTPVSTFIGKLFLVAASILGVTIFILDIAKFHQSASNNAVFIIYGGALLIMAWKVSTNFRVFASVKIKIAYAAYMMALYYASSSIFILLVFVAIYLVLALLAIWAILVFMKNLPSESKKKRRIHYSDGTSEEADVTGRGPTGEVFVKGRESGREFQV